MTVRELKSTSYVSSRSAPENLPEHPEGAMWPVSIGVDGATKSPAAAYWDGSVWCAVSLAEIDRHLTKAITDLYRR